MKIKKKGIEFTLETLVKFILILVVTAVLFYVFYNYIYKMKLGSYFSSLDVFRRELVETLH